MHAGYSGHNLMYIRQGSAEIWRKLRVHPIPSATTLRTVAIGDVVQVLRIFDNAGDRWAHVDTLQFNAQGRVYQQGFLRVPAHNPGLILAPVPELRYYGEVVPGGLPSHLAVGDVVVLVEAYSGPGEAVYDVVPMVESAPPTRGLFERQDVARILSGPIRTPSGLLYWRVRNLNGPEEGYVREYTRSGPQVRFFLRPHIVFQS